MKPIRHAFVVPLLFSSIPMAVLLNRAIRRRQPAPLLHRDGSPRYLYRQGAYFVLEDAPQASAAEIPFTPPGDDAGGEVRGQGADESNTLSPNEYRAVAEPFLLAIRQVCPQAADRVDHIGANNGPRAAYLAAFALLRLKQQQEERGLLLDKSQIYKFTFAEEMRGDEEAIRLYEEAAAYLFPDVT